MTSSPSTSTRRRSCDSTPARPTSTSPDPTRSCPAHAGDRLTATTDHAAVADTDLTFLAVETPARKDGSIDPAALLVAAEDVADKDGYHLVVVKSTVLPGVIENELVPAIERRGLNMSSDRCYESYC